MGISQNAIGILGTQLSGTNPNKTYTLTIPTNYIVDEETIRIAVSGRGLMASEFSYTASTTLITLSLSIQDTSELDFYWDIELSSSAPQSDIDAVRNTLLISDETFLTDARVALAISDAGEDVPAYAASDARAVRYMACWLLARRFKMQSVTRSGDRSYTGVDPTVYEQMYRSRLVKLGGNRAKKINYQDPNVDNGVEY